MARGESQQRPGSRAKPQARAALSHTLRGRRAFLAPGTTVYFVIENLCDYHMSTEPYHYEIISGQIRDVNIWPGSRNDEYVVPTKNRLGRGSCLEYPLCKDLGKSFFLTYEEAAAAADKATDDYERRWSIMNEEPLRRPWRSK